MDFNEHDDEIGGQLVQIRNRFLLPTAKLDDQKFEFYFLLDASGSMGGQRFQLASRALESLPEDCYFNIIAFSSTFKSVFPTSVKYSQQTLNQAKQAIPGLYIGHNTDLYQPLTYVYRCAQHPGYLTQIFSITDGHVGNRDAVLQLVADKVKHSRSFSLGIGDGVDRTLVQGIAENAGGSYEFVTHGELIETKILNQLKVALQPALLKPVRVAGASRLIPMYEP